MVYCRWWNITFWNEKREKGDEYEKQTETNRIHATVRHAFMRSPSPRRRGGIVPAGLENLRYRYEEGTNSKEFD